MIASSALIVNANRPRPTGCWPVLCEFGPGLPSAPSAQSRYSETKIIPLSGAEGLGLAGIGSMSAEGRKGPLSLVKLLEGQQGSQGRLAGLNQGGTTQPPLDTYGCSLGILVCDGLGADSES